MHQARKISAAALAISLLAVSSAEACYKHTFDKCDAPIQVSQVAPASQTAQETKRRASKSQDGWVTTLTVSR